MQMETMKIMIEAHNFQLHLVIFQYKNSIFINNIFIYKCVKQDARH
jgi:hypothetical protein